MADVRPRAHNPDRSRPQRHTHRGGGAGTPALADCFALYLKTKNFHWHVPACVRDYHLLLDDQRRRSWV
ncbi:hypothetical protein AB5I41_20460 [Sphingomonas sp. MMS24-JH45]